MANSVIINQLTNLSVCGCNFIHSNESKCCSVGSNGLTAKNNWFFFFCPKCNHINHPISKCKNCGNETWLFCPFCHLTCSIFQFDNHCNCAFKHNFQTAQIGWRNLWRESNKNNLIKYLPLQAILMLTNMLNLFDTFVLLRTLDYTIPQIIREEKHFYNDFDYRAIRFFTVQANECFVSYVLAPKLSEIKAWDKVDHNFLKSFNELFYPVQCSPVEVHDSLLQHNTVSLAAGATPELQEPVLHVEPPVHDPVIVSNRSNDNSNRLVLPDIDDEEFDAIDNAPPNQAHSATKMCDMNITEVFNDNRFESSEAFANMLFNIYHGLLKLNSAFHIVLIENGVGTMENQQVINCNKNNTYTSQAAKDMVQFVVKNNPFCNSLIALDLNDENYMTLSISKAFKYVKKLAESNDSAKFIVLTCFGISVQEKETREYLCSVLESVIQVPNLLFCTAAGNTNNNGFNVSTKFQCFLGKT